MNADASKARGAQVTEVGQEGPADDVRTEAIVKIDAASNSAIDEGDVPGALGLTAADSGSPLAVLAMAFLYFVKHHRTPAGEEHFGPWIETSQGREPPPLSDIPDDTLNLWEECADKATEPLVRARLHDLCFEARHGAVGHHAVEAIHAYIELAAAYPSASDEQMTRIQIALRAVRALDRALDLANRTKKADLKKLVLERLVDRARVSLDDPAAGPGVVLGFLDSIAHDHAHVPDLVGLLQRARVRYQEDVWHTVSTIQLQLLKAASDDERRQLHRQMVEAKIAAADKETTGLNAVIHLQDAAQLAANYGLSDLREAAITQLQGYAGADLGLTSTTTSVSIPGEVVDTFLDQFAECSSWQAALAGITTLHPPSGEIAENRARASEWPELAPLSTLFPSTQLGPDGLPRTSSAGGDPEHLLVKTEVQHLRLFGPLYVEALRRIGTKWDPIPQGALADFLAQSPHVPPPVASAVARSFGAFFSEEFETAAYTVVPKIERLCRELLLSLGVPVFRVEQGETPGQYAGLGSLLGMLRDRGIDESWARFIDTLLTRQEGLNFRNELLHGSIDSVSEAMAGLALIAALYLAVGIHLVPAGTSSDSVGIE